MQLSVVVLTPKLAFEVLCEPYLVGSYIKQIMVNTSWSDIFYQSHFNMINFILNLVFYRS